MSTYKPAKSPYYQFDFVWKGRRFYGSTGCKTKREADRVEQRERQKAIEGGSKRLPITLDEAAGLYKEKAPNEPDYIFEAAISGLGQYKLLSEIGQRDLQLYIAKRRDGRENSSVNREIEALRAMWRHADASKFDVGEMPAWGKLLLKVVEKDPRELATHEEAALFGELRRDIYDFCLFALKSGWRLSELIGLRWADLDLGNRMASTRIKGGDVVKRPLSQEMLLIIANQPKVGPFVFTYVAVRTKAALVDKKGRKQPARKKGERYPMTKTVLRKPWAAAKEAAGVENFRFHDLRHTRGTRIIRATGNLAAAKKALAHRSIKTTLRYAHVMDEDVRNALDVSDSRTIPGPPSTHVKKAQ